MVLSTGQDRPGQRLAQAPHPAAGEAGNLVSGPGLVLEGAQELGGVMADAGFLPLGETAIDEDAHGHQILGEPGA